MRKERDKDMGEAAVPPLPRVDIHDITAQAGKMPGEVGRHGIRLSGEIQGAQVGLFGAGINVEATQRKLDGYKGEIPSVLLQAAKDAVNGMAGVAERVATKFEGSATKRDKLAQEHEAYVKKQEERRADAGDIARQSKTLKAEAEAQGYRAEVVPEEFKEKVKGPGIKEKFYNWLGKRDRKFQGEATRNAERLHDLADRLRSFIAEKPKPGTEADYNAEIQRLTALRDAERGRMETASKGFERVVTEGKEVATGDRAYIQAKPPTPEGLAESQARVDQSTPVISEMARGK